MNCTLYGKTIENLRNRIDVKLVSNKKYCLKQTSNPIFISEKVFEKNLVAIDKKKSYNET